jgi:hypothetical protein
MTSMKNISNKNVFSIVFVLLLLTFGVFFAESIVLASTQQVGRGAADCKMGFSMMHTAENCDDDLIVPIAAAAADDCDMGRQVVQNDVPISKTVMPCCLERQDNTATTVPSELRERIKFSEYATVENEITPLIATQQKTYLASKSPPKRADILSSVIKIE